MQCAYTSSETQWKYGVSHASIMKTSKNHFVSRFYGRNFSITGIIATFRQAEQRDGKGFQMRHSTNKLAMEKLRTLMEIALWAAFCMQFKFIWYSPTVFIKVQFLIHCEVRAGFLNFTWHLTSLCCRSRPSFRRYYFVRCATFPKEVIICFKTSGFERKTFHRLVSTYLPPFKLNVKQRTVEPRRSWF